MFSYNKKSIIFFGLFCLVEPCLGVRYRNDGQEVRTDLNQLFRENKFFSIINFIPAKVFFPELRSNLQFDIDLKLPCLYCRGDLFARDQFDLTNVAAYNFYLEPLFERLIRKDLTELLTFENQSEINAYFSLVRDLVNRQHLNHGTTCSCSNCANFRPLREEESDLPANQKNFIASQRANELEILQRLQNENLGRIAPTGSPLLPPVVPQVGQPIDVELAESSPWAILSFSRKRVQIGSLVTAIVGGLVAFENRPWKEKRLNRKSNNKKLFALGCILAVTGLGAFGYTLFR